jgi:hypothetical protein
MESRFVFKITEIISGVILDNPPRKPSTIIEIGAVDDVFIYVSIFKYVTRPFRLLILSIDSQNYEK